MNKTMKRSTDFRPFYRAKSFGSTFANQLFQPVRNSFNDCESFEWLYSPFIPSFKKHCVIWRSRINGVLLGTILAVHGAYSMEQESPSDFYGSIVLDIHSGYLPCSKEEYLSFAENWHDDTYVADPSEFAGTEQLLMFSSDYFEAETQARLKKELSDEVNYKDAAGMTALHRAVISNSFDIIQRILSLGADTNAQDLEKKTPMHYAVQGKDPVIAIRLIDALVSNGASVLLEDAQGKIPQECVSHQLVKTHLARCADKELIKKCSEFYHYIVTPVPVRAPTDKIVQSLLEVLSPVNTRPMKSTVAEVPAELPVIDPRLYHMPQPALQTLLQKVKVNPRIVDKTGKTLLHHLMIRGRVLKGVIEAFVGSGGDINARDYKGKTALYYGVVLGRKTVHYLLGQGADPTIADHKGILPYKISKNRYYRKIFAPWLSANPYPESKQVAVVTGAKQDLSDTCTAVEHAGTAFVQDQIARLLRSVNQESPVYPTVSLSTRTQVQVTGDQGKTEDRTGLYKRPLD